MTPQQTTGSYLREGDSPEPEAVTPSTVTFRAMNTTVLTAGAGMDLAPWFATVEATLSRFDPQTALSQLNRNQGRWVILPPLLYHAVTLSLEAAAATDGAFDPTILDGLEAAGYSRTFELGPTPTRPSGPAGRWREILLAPAAFAIKLPHGVRLDLGGIGKGLAVDGAIRLARKAPRVLVNAGGDLRIRTAPGDPPCIVDIEDPRDSAKVIATLAIRKGAIATSSTVGRRWGDGLHHLIDPATGRPARSGVISATVLADEAWWADVLAKAAIVLGPKRGRELLMAQGCEGLLVTESGELITTPRWADALVSTDHV
jgi:thiamine biosynthesis lipoprotein